MALLKQVTDAAWPTSGTPTAGNSGFDALTSSGTLIYEVDENGEKYISTTAPGQSILVRHDPIATVFASGETQHRHEMVFFAEFTGQSGSTAIGTPSGFFIDYDGTAGSGPRCTVSFGANNDGFTAGLFPSFGSPGSTATAYGGLAGNSREPIPINRKFTAQFFVDKTEQIAGLLINGVRVGAWTTELGANFSSNVYFNLPVIAGVRWRIYATAARPARSWTGGTDVFSPLYSEHPPAESDGLIKCWPHIASDNRDGLLWSYDEVVTLSDYTSSGTNPVRRRLIGPSGGVTATSKLDIGTLPFNRYGDAALITSFYNPAGTWQMAVRYQGSTDTAVVIRANNGELQDGNGVQLTASDGTPVAVATDKRYFLVVNLSSNGSASFTLLDATSAPTSRLVWSNSLPSWNVGPLGRILLSADQDSEADRVDICRWWTNAICDSLAAAYSTTATPQLVTTANNLGVGFPHGDALAIPGGAYESDRFGWPKESLMITSGRSGYTRAQWAANSRAHMSHTKAMRMLILDGGCFNDLNGATTADTLIEMCRADLAFCDRNNNEMILMPSFNRPYGLAFSLDTAESNQRRRYNALMPAFVVSNASNPRLYYCDHFRAYREAMLTTDGVHPSAGLDTCCRAIAATRMTARQYANLYGSRVVGDNVRAENVLAA